MVRFQFLYNILWKTAGLLLFVAYSSLGQFRAAPVNPYESDVISARPIRYFIGLALGGYAYQHLGEFSPNCDCVFSDQEKIRPLFGLEFSINYPKLGFAVRMLATFRDYSGQFQRTEFRSATIVGNNSDEQIEFRNSSNVHLQQINFLPSIAWYFPSTEAFWFTGFEIGIPLKWRYDHIEDILTEGFEYFDGGTTTTLLSERDIPGDGRLQFGLSTGFGVDVRLSDRFYLTPSIGITYPLLSVSTEDESWKVLSEYAYLVLKYRLN